MLIPVLTTARLILRGPEERDAQAYARFFASERARYVGGPLSESIARRVFPLVINGWQEHGFGMWTVTIKGDDSSVGLIGCRYPAGWPEREIGWLLWQGWEGKGIAFEAASAVRDHVFSTFAWDSAVSYIAPGNHRSIRLAERLGAKRDEAALFPGDEPCLVYRHPFPDHIDGEGGMEAYA